MVISDFQWVILCTMTIHGYMCGLNVEWIFIMVKPTEFTLMIIKSMVVAWGNCYCCSVVVIL